MTVMEFATFRTGLPWKRSAGRNCVANSFGSGGSLQSSFSNTFARGATCCWIRAARCHRQTAVGF